MMHILIFNLIYSSIDIYFYALTGLSLRESYIGLDTLVIEDVGKILLMTYSP